MKKSKISKICVLISIILTIIFVIKVILDYITYKTTLNSAPFYLWIVVDAIYFLLPALSLLIGGLIAQRRKKEKKVKK